MLKEGSGTAATVDRQNLPPVAAPGTSPRSNVSSDSTTFGILDATESMTTASAFPRDRRVTPAQPPAANATTVASRPGTFGIADQGGVESPQDMTYDVVARDGVVRQLSRSTFPLLGANSTTASAPPTESNVITIVGATCGVVGLLLGMIITAGVWVYVQKRARSSNGRPRHACVVQKNPKEMTFEPLDLTLTLPSYGHVAMSPETRASRENVMAAQQSTPKRPPATSYEMQSSYQGFAPPTPPLPRVSYDQDFSEAFRRDREPIELGTNFGYVNGRFSTHEDLESASDLSTNHRTSGFGKGKSNYDRGNYKEHTSTRLPSITTRDSFSSGLGTGTESEILPHDWCPPARGHPVTNEARAFEKSPHRTRGNRDVSSSAERVDVHRGSEKRTELPTARSSTRSKRSTASGNKQRMARVSDVSSSYPSSGSSSVQDWSTDSSCSPTSTLPTSQDTDAALSLTCVTAISEEDDKTSSLHSAPPGDDEASDGAVTSDDDVVSAYFDMHFPPTPLRSNHGVIKSQSTGNNVQATKTLPQSAERRSNGQVELVRRSSDITINL